MKYPSAFALPFLLALPFLSSAQDFYAVGVSADTNRRAGIYSSSSHDPEDALTLNPAGLTAIPAPTLTLSTSGFFARGSFSNASNDASPMASNHSFVPFVAFGSPLGNHWALGFGLGPDLLSASKWRYADTPGFAGVSYGMQTEKSQIVAFRAAAGLAYRFSDRFSAGVTFGGDYNTNTLDAPYIFQSHPVLAGLKTLLRMHTTGYGWNTSYGLNAQPSKRLNLGASFRTATSLTSHGTATGNLAAEFQAIGLAAAQPSFAYQAQVHVRLPPTALLSTSFQATTAVRLSFQTNWIGWRNSFNRLPVTLTNGSNSDINNLLKSTTLRDTAPLDWKDQLIFRAALERTFGEGVVMGGGFMHGSDPVPASTLSPLTAAIGTNGLTTGIGWHLRNVHFAASYTFYFTAQQQVTNSALLYNEYSNATTKIGIQSFTLSTGFTLLNRLFVTPTREITAA